MNLRLTSLAAAAAVLLGASYAQAGLVQWTIVTSASNVSLAIPDQAINLSGTAATVRIRNQTGSSNVWNAGNKASLQGTFDTQYSDNAGNLQFLAGADTITSINSGSYRPNPAAFNAANTNTANPDGQFQNASLAGGVYGSKIRATVSILTVDLAYLNLYNTTSNIGSPALGLVGVPGTWTTPASGIDSFGIESSQIAVDGISALIVGQVIPDTFTSFTNVFSNNQSVGLITITSPSPILNPLLRRITIPIQVTASTDLDGTPLTIITNGTVVAEALVPEPSTFLMAGVGLVGLAYSARRKLRRRK